MSGQETGNARTAQYQQKSNKTVDVKIHATTVSTPTPSTNVSRATVSAKHAQEKATSMSAQPATQVTSKNTKDSLASIPASQGPSQMQPPTSASSAITRARRATDRTQIIVSSARIVSTKRMDSAKFHVVKISLSSVILA